MRVDDHQRCPDVDGVYAAGDCVESHHRVLDAAVNIQLGTHANKQGRIAGVNATGGDVAFPGVVGTAVSKVCKYEVARTGITETEAEQAGIEVVSAIIKSSTRATYYPGAGPIWVKLVADPSTGRVLGGQIVGVEGAAKRIDVLAACVWTGMAVDELALMDLSYAPPYSPVYDPLLVAARAAAKVVEGAEGGRAPLGASPAGSAAPGQLTEGERSVVRARAGAGRSAGAGDPGSLVREMNRRPRAASPRRAGVPASRWLALSLPTGSRLLVTRVCPAARSVRPAVPSTAAVGRRPRGYAATQPPSPARSRARRGRRGRPRARRSAAGGRATPGSTTPGRRAPP